MDRRLAGGVAMIDNSRMPLIAMFSVLGIGGGGERKDIDLCPQVPQAFLLAHAESMFLVDDDQSEVRELYPGDEQAVGADGDVDRATGEPLADVLCFAVGAQAGYDLDFDRPIGEAVAKRLVVLLGEQGGRRQNRDLLAGLDGDECGAHGDFGLAESDIPADQAVGGRFRLEIGQHRVDRALLVGRRLEGKLLAETGVVVVRGAEDRAGTRFAPRVDVEQLGGHIVDLFRRPPLRLVPLVGTEAVQRRVIAVGAGIPGNEVQRGYGYVEAALFGVVDGEKFLRVAVYLEGLEAPIPADAVVGVHHGRADGQFRQVADDEIRVDGASCAGRGAVGAVAEDLRLGDQREFRQLRSPIQVGDREGECRSAPKKCLEIIDFHDAYAGAGEELGEMLPAPRCFGGQQHGDLCRIDERSQVACFVPTALARHQVRQPAAAEVDAVAAPFAIRIYPQPGMGGQSR